MIESMNTLSYLKKILIKFFMLAKLKSKIIDGLIALQICIEIKDIWEAIVMPDKKQITLKF
ncbi:hypothetical protein EF513_00650 [Rickettsiales endosymbiont of Stachyamoeba lipophora]|nr:hypothetical protein EF513_00650 [Rickettsiales endosymbiont of Stachyamoeba lipophora]